MGLFAIFGSARVWMLAAVAGGTLLGANHFVSAAANTVPAAKVGEGSGNITGYVISNVNYNLNGTTRNNIDSVTFDVDADPSGSTMLIRLVSGGNDWYTCTNVTTAVTCVTTSPQATINPSDRLDVIIAE